MSRQIKFRAWMPKESRWYRGGAVQLIATQNGSFQVSEVNRKIIEISQYTGIKDKNGVDIYEGDIIEWFRKKPENGEFYPDRTKRKAVVWEEYNRCVGFNLRPTQNEQESYWEVIGNVYEHPDLLKQA